MLSPRQSPRPLPLDATDLLLMLIVTLGSVRLLAPLLAGIFAVDAVDDELTPGAALAVGLLLMLVQYLVLLGMIQLLAIRKHGLAWRDLGLQPPTSQWIRMAIITGVFCLPMVHTVTAIFRALFDMSPENPQLDVLVPAGFSWPALVAVMVMVGALGPFAEEVAFRGILYPWLRARLGVVLAIFLSAFGFGLLHGIPQLIPPIMALGVVLALATQYSGSIWPAIIIHATFNIISAMLLYIELAARAPGG